MSNPNNDPPIWLILAAVTFCICLPAIIWIFSSHMEAKSYNRLTGSDATTWEAMWTELRVTGTPQRHE